MVERAAGLREGAVVGDRAAGVEVEDEAADARRNHRELRTRRNRDRTRIGVGHVVGEQLGTAVDSQGPLVVELPLDLVRVGGGDALRDDRAGVDRPVVGAQHGEAVAAILLRQHDRAGVGNRAAGRQDGVVVVAAVDDLQASAAGDRDVLRATDLIRDGCRLASGNANIGARARRPVVPIRGVGPVDAPAPACPRGVAVARIRPCLRDLGRDDRAEQSEQADEERRPQRRPLPQRFPPPSCSVGPVLAREFICSHGAPPLVCPTSLPMSDRRAS